MIPVNRGNLRLALAGVRGSKLRSFLTMLGIVLGVVSVVLVVGIGQGVQHDVAKQIDQFGKDLITIRPGNITPGGTNVMNSDLLFGLNSVSGLNDQDLKAVQSSAHVQAASPLSLVPGALASDDAKIDNSLVIATNSALPALLKQKLQFGEFFDGTAKDSAVIGKSMAQALFNDDVPLGRTFTFRGQDFVVRGIFDHFDSSPLSPLSNFNNAIFIPFAAAQTITGNRAQMYSILARPDKQDNSQAAILAVTNNLLAAHGGQHDFTVLNHDQNIAASSNVLDLLTSLVIAVAAISLLVGGVGIMNIMLASVTERTYEIGVRKAIGASSRQILNQFLLEAVVLSLVGGIIGALVASASIGLLRIYSPLHPIMSWQAVGIGVSTSLAIGIIFGVIPAAKAAAKDPIQALRHE